MRNIRLSICIPTYNFGAFIGETLESVIAQATEDVEIVIVDGASTDNTQEVVRSFQKRFPEIVYHRLQRKGGIDNDLVRAVDYARGDYCWLLSSDDVPYAGCIQRMIRELESECDIYLYGRTVCEHDLTPSHKQRWLDSSVEDRIFRFRRREEYIDYFSRSRSIGALFSYISSVVVKRERWNSAVPDKTVIGTHYAHVARLFVILQQGGSLRYIREALVHCRGGNDSFAQQGVARRFLIDLNGYLALAETLFKDVDVKEAFLAVMRREHPWWVFADIRSKEGTCEQWGAIERRLKEFGYKPYQVLAADRIGSLRPVVVVARLVWYWVKRCRTFVFRIERER